MARVNLSIGELISSLGYMVIGKGKGFKVVG